MPRFVRPCYVVVTCDDRSSPVGTGPRARDGSVSATFTMRDEGSVSPACDVHAYGTSDKARACVQVTANRDGRIVFPDGREIEAPKGTRLNFATFQDPGARLCICANCPNCAPGCKAEGCKPPARLVSDSGWTDPATGAPMSPADVTERIRSARASRGSSDPLARLRHHVTGAIERGEAVPIVETPATAGHPPRPVLGQCSCRPGIARDNCPACEGTGLRLDFRAIRDATGA